MNLAYQLIQTFEQTKESSLTLQVLEGEKKRKKKTSQELIIDKVLSAVKADDLLLKKSLLTKIEAHPLYIEPASDVSESFRFGWNRGSAFKAETLIRGRWYVWFHILNKGRFDAESDNIPSCPFSMFDGRDEVNKMLENCMNHVYNEGARVSDFLEWIGYSLGISSFSKPKIIDRLWEKLYTDFDLSIMLFYPSDYLSNLLSTHGQSGVASYFPTPMNVAQAMTRMLNVDSVTGRAESVYEPTLGAGALLLPSDSLILTGTELNPIMCRAASIQAFLYAPWLLYTPIPVIGLHFSEEEMRMNRYFEFTTNTRIYCGDALLGEFTAPEDIFDENSKTIDVYLHALDLEKREVYQYEGLLMTTAWSDIPEDLKWKITIAQARELGFTVVMSNPPFGKMNSFTLQRIHEIEAKNEKFIRERSFRLERKHPLMDAIEHDTELRLDEATGQYQLIF
jgi:hypothetical protein